MIKEINEIGKIVEKEYIRYEKIDDELVKEIRQNIGVSRDKCVIKEKEVNIKELHDMNVQEFFDDMIKNHGYKRVVFVE